MLYEKKRLPLGMEFFDELRRKDCYYVDKTALISELIRSSAEVNLFTRPRRFGKTLTMTMLKCFFEIGGDPAVFDGLAIAEEVELCENYMGKFPVIFVSLKSVDADSFETARGQMKSVIAEEAGRLRFLLNSDCLDDFDKESFRELMSRQMGEQTLSDSLRTLTRLLETHYGKKTILLIDEYDVPLQKAFYGGYYDQMVRLLCSMFSQALKTNSSLEFAVLTGCLRISKESIFTGMNNLRVFTIADTKFDEYFGFTDPEVREMLKYYGLEASYERVREWYDGYRFGSSDLYCPWDVINYCFDLESDPKLLPQDYWANSSGNDAVRQFVKQQDVSVTRQELEALTAGEVVRKEIHQELTYREMYNSAENLWSLLYMTGYLTKRGEAGGRVVPLSIPNMEIRDIFRTQILDLFKENTKKDGETVREFCGALKNGNAARVQELFGLYLKKTVSIRDTFVKRNLKENFYHGILLGILGFKGNWYVFSNYETGDGYGDILIETEDDELGIVIEVKYAQDGDLEKGAKQALKQIREKRYEEKLYDDGIRKVLRYGIACYKKRCCVVLEETCRPSDK